MNRKKMMAMLVCLMLVFCSVVSFSANAREIEKHDHSVENFTGVSHDEVDLCIQLTDEGEKLLSTKSVYCDYCNTEIRKRRSGLKPEEYCPFTGTHRVRYTFYTCACGANGHEEWVPNCNRCEPWYIYY